MASAKERIALTSGISALTLPPRLNDIALSPLSISNHIKYLYLYNRLRFQMGRLGKTWSEDIISEFSSSAAWFRNVDRLFRFWCPAWAFHYIDKTSPAGDWPYATLDILSFAWSFLFRLPIGQTLVTCSTPTICCAFCGHQVSVGEMRLRFAVPYCGCDYPMQVPRTVGLLLDPDYPVSTTAVQDVAASQKTFFIRNQRQDYTLAFLANRRGKLESQILRLSQNSIPTFVFESADEYSRRVSSVERIGIPGCRTESEFFEN